MNTNSGVALVCPSCMGSLSRESDALVCRQCPTVGGRRFPYLHGLPSFLQKSELAPQDRHIQRVYDFLSLTYDKSVVFMFAFLGLREADVRNEIINDLIAPRGGKILEVSVGTGANIPLLRNRFPGAELHGCDISLDMMRKCQKRLQREGMKITLSHCNASALPYRDNEFDALLHVGGINSFADKEKALLEMLRVIKPGGCVVINDEGLSPERQKQLYARILVKAIFSFVASLERGDMDPPMKSIPSSAVDVRLHHIGKGYFWNLCFKKPPEKSPGN